MCPMGFHQDYESSDDPTDLTKVMGDQDSQRHSDHVRVSSASSTTPRSVNSHPTVREVMTPTQELEFLGIMVNTNTLLVSLPAEKVKQIRAETTWISNMTSLPARLLAHFLGNLSAATQAVPPAPLFYRCLQRDLQAALAANGQNCEAHLFLSQATL